MAKPVYYSHDQQSAPYEQLQQGSRSSTTRGSHNDADPRQTPGQTTLPPQTFYHPSRSPMPHPQDTKLSLPPLRVAFPEFATGSPPATPASTRATIQPSPREPTYNLPPYKPPALYPNRPTSRAGYDSKAPRASPDSTVSTGTSPPPRRDSVARPTLADRQSWYSQANYGARPDTLSRVPTREEQPQYLYGAPENHSPATQQPTTAGLSSQGGRVVSDGYAPLEPAGQYTPQPESVYAAEQSGQQHAYYQQQSPAVTEAQYNEADCTQNQPGYAPPSVYDYQGSKARKRSNLPKHSTEIMKTWFDSHMENPYPSEEEKRIFARAANINLTQVSNWFINHRRRCPELKDKREKSQSDNRDEYY